MVEVAYAIFSEYSFPDKNDKGNIVGIFDSIWVKGDEESHTYPSFYVLLNVKGIVSDFTIELYLEHEGTNKKIGIIPEQKSPKNDADSIMINARKEFANFEEQGCWKLKLKIDGELIETRASLHVKHGR